ncbi:MAG: hypothetical protein Q8L20_04490 [Gammaproteobacteria bacterium]|nr:hypothetical protein [Gammaproteobacteria bacterium]
MTELQELSEAAAEYRRHFDQYFLGVIPRLLNEDGMFLSFMSVLIAVDSLAGVYLPDKGTGERFRAFFSDFFPASYGAHAAELWQFRNHMIHSMNPQPFMILCRNSRMHLCESSGVRMLNAEDFYADLITASRAYFSALYADLELQNRFAQRIKAGDGGRARSINVVESVKTAAITKSPEDQEGGFAET